MLADLIQNTLDGLSIGAAYALLALGFTLIFGVLRRANLSYGAAIMFGCYCATWTHLNFGAGLLLLAAITVAGTVLAGAYVERLCFAPHRGGSMIAAMVASFALWMQFEELVTLVMPTHLYAFPALYEGAPLAFGPYTLRVDALVMLGAAIAACALLWGTLYRTRFGLAVRAVTEQPAAASLAGINLPRVYVRVFALASAIGGVAGKNILPPLLLKHVVHLERAAGDDARRPGFTAGCSRGRHCARAAGSAQPVVPRPAAARPDCLPVAVRPARRESAMDAYTIGVLTNIGLFSFVALSAYLLLVAGELSFGQQAFFGIGAYAGGICTAMYGWPLPLAALAAMALGASAQFLVGYLLERRPDDFVRYYQALLSGTDSREKFAAIFGPLEAVEAGWLEYLRTLKQ